MSINRCVRIALLVLAGVAFGASASAQNPAQLPVGKTVGGQTTEAQPGTFRFNAPSAGSLAVAVKADSDVSLAIVDVDGQTLADGTADNDLFGDTGSEQLIVTLPEAGEYRVQVKLVSGNSTKFQIGAGWIAMAGFARTVDPDRRPSMAAALEVGQGREDSLDEGAGDNWDWFVVTPKTAGTLTVITRSTNDSSPDLAIELYTANDLSTPAVRADDDQQGKTTNESATIDVTAGAKLYVKITGAVGGASGPYRLTSSLVQ